ncbi:MAG: RNA polymerase sigma factor [Acidobacteriia bacterium]|nr:RNA polymerase sigma factor [Terriglobia bacterium]
MNYDDLYAQYYRRVRKYLRGIVGDTEAEDLAQEVFIKVGVRLGTLKDEARVSSWIFKIALNTARDRLRKAPMTAPACNRASSPVVEPVEETAERLPDSRLRTPEENLARSEMFQCYFDFVKKLPRHYFDVYALSEFEELPDKEISERLSLPLETVKMRLHRARAKLYDELRTHCRCYYNERGELMGYPK